MTALTILTRAGDRLTGSAAPPDAATTTGSSRLRSLGRHLAERRASILVLGLLLLVAAAAHAINMFGNPQVIDDEGTYVAQAWAVVTLGDLTHYTYWYDHPPLGWLQLAGYAEATGAFGRVDHAVDVGREFMLVVQLLSVVVLWALCRRLRLARWSTAVAVLVFALSPLAIQFHRTVFLDNIAVLWLLLALWLAASPGQRLAEMAGAAVAFAAAVLTKETFLLLLPAVALLMWQSTHRSTRRYTLAVVASLLIAVGSAYVLLALLKGELIPEPGQVSLLDGLRFQLLGRESGGSVFDPASANRATLDVWLGLDVILPTLALVLTPIALAVRRLRAVAVGFAILALTLLRPGYLPVPLIIGALPLAAVLVGGMADEAMRQRSVTWWPTWARVPRMSLATRPFAPLVSIMVVAAVAAAPGWAVGLRGLFLYQPNRPVIAAGTWLEGNLSRENRLMVDDAFWVDLVEAGFDRSNVVWAYKVDTDPAVEALSPNGWRDYDYVVVTDSMRRNDSPGDDVTLALQNSVTVAQFQANGVAETTVEIRRIVPGGLASLPTAQDAAEQTARRVAAAQALRRNPRITIADPALALLLAGDVDERLLTIVAGASQDWSLTVSDFPVVDGEQDLDAQRRVAVVRTAALASQGVLGSFEEWLDRQSAVSVAATVTAEGTVISVPPRAPGESTSVVRTPTTQAAPANTTKEPS